MHLLVREARSLDEEQGAVDLGHAPADIVFLSFSDSDLGAAAMAWQAMGTDRPSLRLANLAKLRHPMSVDLYVERVVSHARCVLVRLLGGLDYWPYGAHEFSSECRSRRIPLAILPGDARDDARLRQLCTVPDGDVELLDGYLRHGGPENLAHALRLAAHLAGLGPGPKEAPKEIPSAGLHTFALRSLSAPRGGEGWGEVGVSPPARSTGAPREPCHPPHPDPLPPQALAEREQPGLASRAVGTAAIVFYRSHLLAGDVAPIEDLANELQQRGFHVRALYVSSLKDPNVGNFVAGALREWRPVVVLNATGFAAAHDGNGSPLDAAGVPVLQLVLSGAPREAWAAASRGVSQSDLAMQVVLPELDGRLLTTAISFKAETAPLPGLDFSRVVNRPDPDGIALAADRALGWARLAATQPRHRRVAIVLSDYPGAGGGQVGHAVGLDTFASLRAILDDLAESSYDVGVVPGAAALTGQLCRAAPAPFLDLRTYKELFSDLPAAAREKIVAAWGEPEADPAVQDENFVVRLQKLGNVVVAVQPDRGNALDRKATYHDPDLPPRHAYVAFYLWLRNAEKIQALVHLGTHGTLEWLPGKAAALSADCIPVSLLRGMPVIYPFIVNNPGEAAAAKRRLGAVTIGHLTPPLRAAGTHGAASELERLIDEYAAADGLDRRRAATLRRDILERAEAAGLLAESGVAQGAPDDEALARLDAYLCDVKDLQIRDGLHVFGREPAPELRSLLAATTGGAIDACAPAERAALLAALDARFVSAGPAGAPTRGRADVLPTGRNLFAIDPRAVPTRSALALAEKAAAELLRRHMQDHGDWPRSLVTDLWGSATLRTGGEDFALALLLLGVRPIWDDGSARVSGFEILPLAELDRPRIDVTLRISGLFRDAFEAQILLFDAAVRAVAARNEAADWNPLAAAAHGLEGAALRRATSRVFGAAPGSYGAGVGDVLDRGAWQHRDELGRAYLAASAHAYGRDLTGAADATGFATRLAAADAFVHVQDHAETDLLEGTEHAAHEGGFAAAAHSQGGAPALYHLDTSRPEAPRSRTVAEELARIVRGRAANPAWIAGMMRHGYRGAAEIARAVDGLHGFAATLPQRLDAQFDLLFDATLGSADVDAFLREANPDARAAIAARFRDALRRDLWRPHRNHPAEVLVP